MLLFIIFTGLIGLLIVRGQGSYDTVLQTKEQNENTRIAFSYINMKIKQNNSGDSIQVLPSPYNTESNMIDIVHSGPQKGLVTHILYYEGYLYECYQLVDDPVDVRLGEQIVPLDETLLISYDETTNLITVQLNDRTRMNVYANAKAVME